MAITVVLSNKWSVMQLIADSVVLRNLNNNYHEIKLIVIQNFNIVFKPLKYNKTGF